MGAFLVARHPKVGLGNRQMVTLWLRVFDGTPQEAFARGANLNLTLLMGYRLQRQWGCRLRIVAVVQDAEEEVGARDFLREICDLARLPPEAEQRVLLGTFDQAVESLAGADINIFGLQPEPDFQFVRRMVTQSRSTCLFVVDSGRESALV